MPLLESAFASRPRDEWLRILADHDIPAAPDADAPGVHARPGGAPPRDGRRSTTIPRWARSRLMGQPLRFSETQAPDAGPPPTLGQHTAEVLREAGYADTRSPTCAAAAWWPARTPPHERRDQVRGHPLRAGRRRGHHHAQPPRRAQRDERGACAASCSRCSRACAATTACARSWSPARATRPSRRAPTSASSSSRRCPPSSARHAAAPRLPPRDGALPAADHRRHPRLSRSAAASSWRSPATSASPRRTRSSGLTEVNLAIIPGGGGTQRLPRLVGRGKALEMILTGARIPAAEALRIGLVERVVPVAELPSAAQALARTLADKAPVALRYAKEAVVERPRRCRSPTASASRTTWPRCSAPPRTASRAPRPSSRSASPAGAVGSVRGQVFIPTFSPRETRLGARDENVGM